MTTQNPIHFYHQVESFILDSASSNISGDKSLDNEIALFLLMLLHCHKEREGLVEIGE